MRPSIFALVVFGSIASIACGSSGNEPRVDPPIDSGSLPEVESDAPIDAAPETSAPKPPTMPEVTSAGGPVMSAPKLTVVTFGDEPFASALETFAKDLGATSYWSSTTKEYGVGPATFSRSVHISAV